MGVGSGPKRSKWKPVPPSPPTPSPSSASEAEVVGRGASPVANLPPNTASAGAEAPAATKVSAVSKVRPQAATSSDPTYIEREDSAIRATLIAATASHAFIVGSYRSTELRTWW